MPYSSLHNTHFKERGLTIVEVLVISPLIVLIVGVIIGYLVTITGDGLVASQKNVLAYNVQNALGKIEMDTQNAIGFLATKSDSNSTVFTTSPGGAPNYISSGPLIVSSLATTKSPLNPDRSLVYLNKNGCSSAAITFNERMKVTYIYFVSGGTLWKRTVLGDGTPCNSTRPWQRSSCSPGYAPSSTCQAEDELVMPNIQSLQIQYFSDSKATTPTSDINQAKSVRASVVSSKSLAGEQLSFNGDVRTSLSKDLGIAPAEVTFGPNLTANSSFESNISGWESNTAFGVYAQSSYFRTTSRASSGSASLEVTLPTNSGGDGSWVNTYNNGLIIGRLYRFQADVWIPSSGNTPNPGIDLVFKENQDRINVPRNEWATLTFYWKATHNDAFYGVGIRSPTSGQKMWVDNVKLQIVN